MKVHPPWGSAIDLLREFVADVDAVHDWARKEWPDLMVTYRKAQGKLLDHGNANQRLDGKPMTDTYQELKLKLQLSEQKQAKMFEKIDWPLLRDQKQELIKRIDKGDLLWGLVYLIDEIQDHAVDVLGVDKDKVFMEGEK